MKKGDSQPTPSRLWDKGDALDRLIHAFTVGDDPQVDLHLVYWDCLGSAAHARTLEKAGVLTSEECAGLIAGLAEIARLASEGRFEIPLELEDCHTAIEAHLTTTAGEAGQKIHTGRSRNDQVATAMRLYMRHHALRWMELLDRFACACLERARRDGDVPMPGYTHLQPAMPSSVGLWLAAWAEAAVEHMASGLDLLHRLDRCPLGTGAGFGISLPLDRQWTAELLGFSKIQRNPIDVQNSRGRFETYFLRVGVDVAGMLEKLAVDLVLFATREFGFVKLPVEMTTGSSIMPQKRNPDVVELVRGHAGVVRGRLAQLEWVCAKLPSSYHRDLQLTKAPVVAGVQDVDAMLTVMTRVVDGLAFDAQRLRAAMSDELYAADAAYALVRQGVPFREAYRRVGADIAGGAFSAPDGAGHSAGSVQPQALGDLNEERARLLAAAEAFRGRERTCSALLK